MNNFRQGLIKKLLGVLGILSILIGGLIFFGWNINHRAQNIKNQRQELADRSEALSLFAHLQSQFSQAQPHFSILENVLPTRDQLFNFPKELEKMAVDEKIGFGFSFGSETFPSADQPGRVAFTISIQGPLYKLFKLIKDMEGSRFLINFQNFDFTREADNVRLLISGEVFYH